jgi:pimeloyl-ACP methyl ester carboxylesterase
MNLIIFGYRGYGKSEGIPSEKGLMLDGLAISHYVFEDEEVGKYVDRDQVFLFGRSLGGAVAACVALDTSLPFKGVIIENTFTTLGDLVDIMFPPLKYFKNFLLKTKFETAKIIGKIKRPILFCRSENDELIPKSQMDSLFNLAKRASFKRYYIIKNGTHNDGFRFDIDGYAKAIKDYINECNEYYSKKAANEKKDTKISNDNNDVKKPKLD